MKKKKKIQQRSKIKWMGDDLKHVRACKVTMSFWLFGLIFIRRGSRHTRTNISSLHLCLSVSMRSNPKAPPPVFCHDVMLALSTFVYISGCLLRHAEHNPQHGREPAVVPSQPPQQPLSTPPPPRKLPGWTVCTCMRIILVNMIILFCFHVSAYLPRSLILCREYRW